MLQPILRHSYTSISHFFVCPSVRPSVHPSVPPSVHPLVCYKDVFRLFVASSKVFLNVLVCSFVCLPDFSKGADARDLGLMTLLLLLAITIMRSGAKILQRSKTILYFSWIPCPKTNKIANRNNPNALVSSIVKDRMKKKLKKCIFAIFVIFGFFAFFCFTNSYVIQCI